MGPKLRSTFGALEVENTRAGLVQEHAFRNHETRSYVWKDFKLLTQTWVQRWVQSCQMPAETVFYDATPDIRLSYGQVAHMVVDVTTVTSQGSVHRAPSNPPIDSFRDLCANFVGAPAYSALLIHDPMSSPNPQLSIKRAVRRGLCIRHCSMESCPGIIVLALENHLFTNEFRRRAGQALPQNPDLVQALAAFGKPVGVVAGKSFDFDAPLITEKLQGCWFGSVFRSSQPAATDNR
jgi:hypothetical protein